MKQLFALIALFAAYTSFGQPAWQQRVDTKIDVTLDDHHHYLSAHEEFTYTNNSPDTLHYIYLHLWPNAYKNDHTPMARQMDLNGKTDFYYAKAKDRGYIDSLQFTVDGVPVDNYSTESTPDIARIDLPKPLLPGHSIKVATPFKVKIPKVFSRMGHTGQAYFISQWFPKPAVYDQKGWHPISYLDQGEFYSEYGSYDVSITLPANYVVMATGNCTDEKELKWLDELAQKPLPNRRVKLTIQLKDTAVASSPELKTVHFHEDNVHDFAWFADKRWAVRKDTTVIPGTNEIVTTWAAFLPSYWQQWEKATNYLKETVHHYSKWVGPYQYKTIKAVSGDMHAGGGMEYPTITIIDKSAWSKLQMVVIHEGGHNWFQGMLGSNERDHAWLDEGINTFYEQKTTRDLDNDASWTKKKKLDENLIYFQRAATHRDQAIDQTSENFEKLNYGLDVYYKTALSLRWLEQYMGEENFEAGMHEYFNRWHFHHPYPEDLRECLMRHTNKTVDYFVDGKLVHGQINQSIGWFFDTVLNNENKIDYKIIKAKTTDGLTTRVTVRNNTGVSAPVLINAYDHDSLISTAWSQPFSHTATVDLYGTTWNKLTINEVIPDAKSTNDVYRRHAMFHRFGVKLKPFFGINMSEKDKLFISPAVAYNQYDGIMAGLVLHDLTLPENRFRFALAPLYSFETQSLVGAGSLGYVWYPGGFIKEVLLQVDGKTFHYNETDQQFPSVHHFTAGYTKIAPSLNITFDEHDAKSPVTRTLTLKGYSIDEDFFSTASSSIAGETYVAQQHHNYSLVNYQHRNDRTYNPFSYRLQGQLGTDYGKLTAEGNIRIDYNTKKRALYVRAFLGKFFAISNDLNAYSRYELNSSYTAMDDYLYDGTYIARSAVNNKGAAHQVSIQEGGFTIPTYNNVGRSDNWMATINLKSDLPLPRFLPIRLFFDAGLIPNPTPTMKKSSNTTLLYEGGVEVYIIKDVVSLYIPIIMSSDFQNYLNDTYGKKNAFTRSLSFTLQFQNINWLKAPSKTLKVLTGN
jgi:Peptidase family M1 domain